ncbi:restriction endonuclease subunit S [Candidatus Poriferisocius sp.]|uniref:restriction endonuclease subunit S n=1 Tax=Candidatus Poriferisocius sp. TaxID=3101276 RepID=UPI003B5A3460
MKRELPEGWEWVPLGEACEVVLGQSPPGSSYNSGGQGMPFFQGKAEFGERFPTICKWTTEPKRMAPLGATLLSIRAPVGPTNIAPVDCAIGRGLAALCPTDLVKGKYLFWVMRSTAPRLAENATGSTFEAVNGNQVRSHPIPIAPLEEQEQIVAAIEEHLSSIAIAREQIDRAMAHADILGRRILSTAFSGRLLSIDDNRKDLAHRRGRDIAELEQNTV